MPETFEHFCKCGHLLKYRMPSKLLRCYECLEEYKVERTDIDEHTVSLLVRPKRKQYGSYPTTLNRW